MNRSLRRRALVTVAIGAVCTSRALAQDWVGSRCDLKPGHYLVNSGVLYLKSAVDTKFADKKEKDLRDAHRVLEQAITSGGQQKNPAAWYYLGRYYVEMKDAAGADSAFTNAVALAPGCTQDVYMWRRLMWVPVINTGVAAWQAGNKDSAIATFRRANQLYAGEPIGFAYLGMLFAGRNHTDSAAKYFKLAVQAATDPQYEKDKKDAMFNLARVYHAARQYEDAEKAYKEYLAAYPGDMQATASLAAVYSVTGQRDQGMAMYIQILQRADSADAMDLFDAGRAILNGIAHPPDTAVQGTQCRSEARRTSHTLTARQVAARCDSLTSKAMRDFDAAAQGSYRLVEQAFEAGLAKNPYNRDALFTLTGVAALAGDTARALAAAPRLYAVDPLNRATLQMVAQAWKVKGKTDSTLHYLQLVDSVEVEVSVGGFTPDEKGATLSGLFTNLRTKPSLPRSITFEFLDAKGAVVATQAQDVPVIASGENKAFELKVSGAGIVAWRYRGDGR